MTLDQCNETELLWMAKDQGIGRLKKGLPKEYLIDIILGEIPPITADFSGTHITRNRLAIFIHNPAEFPPDGINEGNWPRVMSQLPGCTGICTKFDCTEGRHALCILPNIDTVQRR